MLSEKVSSLLKPFKLVTESNFDVSLGSGETRKCFRVIMFCCCHTPKAEDRSSARRGATKEHPCIRCHGRYENRMMGRERSCLAMAETMET